MKDVGKDGGKDAGPIDAIGNNLGHGCLERRKKER
jgi:hypothetical protein